MMQVDVPQIIWGASACIIFVLTERALQIYENNYPDTYGTLFSLSRVNSMPHFFVLAGTTRCSTLTAAILVIFVETFVCSRKFDVNLRKSEVHYYITKRMFIYHFLR